MSPQNLESNASTSLAKYFDIHLKFYILCMLFFYLYVNQKQGKKKALTKINNMKAKTIVNCDT